MCSGQDVLVGARLQGEDRRLELRRPLRRPRRAVPLARGAVEADRPGEAVPARRREPGVAAAEAEADREHGLAAAAVGRAQVLDGGADVLLDPLRRRLRHVLHVRELVVALADARRAAEVVERDGGVAALGEAQRELLVEAVEAAHVGQHDDADRRRLVGQRHERREPRSVGGLERDVLRATRAPRPRGGIGGRESSSKHIAARRYSAEAVRGNEPGGVASRPDEPGDRDEPPRPLGARRARARDLPARVAAARPPGRDRAHRAARAAGHGVRGARRAAAGHGAVRDDAAAARLLPARAVADPRARPRLGRLAGRRRGDHPARGRERSTSGSRSAAMLALLVGAIMALGGLARSRLRHRPALDARAARLPGRDRADRARRRSCRSCSASRSPPRASSRRCASCPARSTRPTRWRSRSASACLAVILARSGAPRRGCPASSSRSSARRSLVAALGLADEIAGRRLAAAGAAAPHRAERLGRRPREADARPPFAIALVAFADTSVLSRSYAAKLRQRSTRTRSSSRSARRTWRPGSSRASRSRAARPAPPSPRPPARAPSSTGVVAAVRARRSCSCSAPG